MKPIQVMATPHLNLSSLKINVEKNKKNEERAKKINDEYFKTIDAIIKQNSKYQDKSISIVDNITFFQSERDQLKNNTYHNYTHANTFIDTILHIIEWFKDSQSKITFKTIEKMIDLLRFEKHSKYLIRNILDNPLELIQIDHSPINFSQAYRIVKELNIEIANDILIRKWAIFAIQDNNGSFYKIKSHVDSKNLYKNYNDRCYKQGWYYLLRNFCEENNILSKYPVYLDILNTLLVKHNTMKYVYGIKEFIDIEKNIGDTLLDMYHDDSNEPPHNGLKEFIRSFEINKSTPTKPFKLNDEQILAIEHAINDKLCVITGPPGTGKSTIIEAVIEWFNLQAQNSKHDYNISLMSPTGKAFKGLLNKCKNIQDEHVCGTLHKCLLNTFPKIEKHREYSPDSNEKNMLPDLIHHIIVDEASMIDIFMFKLLLQWCQYFECKLILLGDIKQLPPIGKGRPFECIINSQLFNTMYLVEIKRQDAGKLKDCIININNRELSISDFDDTSTIFIDHDFTNHKQTIKLCKKLVDKYGKDRIVFLTPENGKESGVFEMNKLLQNNVYNPDKIYIHGYLKDGDYVMRTENKYDDDKIRVNGDTGVIYFKDPAVGVSFRFRNPTTGEFYKHNMAQVKYDDDDTNTEYVPLDEIKDNFMLNYCNTVHKYQGSQKDVVVFICSPLHNSLAWGTNRLKLAYTAISRAAQTLIVIGNKEVFFNIQKCTDDPFVTSFMSEFTKYEFD
jgi:hypothetical protein